MQSPTARSHHESPHAGVTAVSRADDSAGSFDYRDEGLNIIGLQPSIHGQIHIPHGQHGIDIAIAAVLGQLYRRFQPIKAGTVAGILNEARTGRRQNRLV
jgi:hypothetical protein